MFKKIKLTFLVLIFLFCQPYVSLAESPNKNAIVFLIDTSGSMKGEKILEVKKAFNAIINIIPEGVEVSVITFSSKASILVPQTTDKKLLKDSVSNLQANGETAIFDAVYLALENVNELKNSRLVLLTDGEDTVSNYNLIRTINKITSKLIPIDSIGLQTNELQSQTLLKISDSSNGKFYSITDLNGLIQAYKESLSPIIDSIEIANPEQDKYQVLNDKNKYGLEPYAISVSVFFIILFLYSFIKKIYSKNKYKKRRFQVIQKYDIRRLANSEVLRSFENLDYEVLPRFLKIWIRSKLELIHSEISFERAVNILAILFVSLSIFFYLLISNVFISAIFGAIGTFVIFDSYIKNRRQIQVRQFADELPDFLNIVSSALKSGLTLGQGLEAFALENRGEVARQIRRASSEIQMGSTIEDSLMNIAIRMKNDDLKWTVTALSIQRNVGGSFAGILSTTHTTVKERAEIRREIRTLSAEGKLSAYILMALPLGIFFFLFLTKRDYVSVFWTRLEGIFLLGIIAFALSIGWIWIKKIIEIKI